MSIPCQPDDVCQRTRFSKSAFPSVAPHTPAISGLPPGCAAERARHDDISAKVTADQPIVAERPMYFHSDLLGGVVGGTTVVGATSPAREFDFAEGTTRPGFAEFLALQNPGDVTASVSVEFQAPNENGFQPTFPGAQVVVWPRNRATFDVTAFLAAHPPAISCPPT